MKITTNNHDREFIYKWDLTEDEIERFDYLDEDEIDGFIRYKGHVYHLSEFMRTDHFIGWCGYSSDSFFSGVLIKVSDDCETYRIGTYFSSVYDN